MTLKKQFSILASFIIAIPVFCVVFLASYYYVKSPDRILIKEYTQLKKQDPSLYSKQDWNTIYSSLNSLPPETDAALVSGDKKVLLSTIPEIPVNTEISFTFLWQIQNFALRKNYYQFSVIETTSENMLLITKVSKNVRSTKTKISPIPALLFFLAVIVLISFAFLLHIFNNINKSISRLEKQTHKIADGDLNIKIESEGKDIKSNEITSISKSLEQMRISLLEAQNQQTKFIMGISHDLRTPVAVIKGYTEALTDGIITEPEELQNTYSLISSKTEQLQAMIDSLINFMKMNYKDLRETFSLESITTLIKDFVQDAQLTSNVFNRKVICNINISEDFKIPMNKSLIYRVFENIFSNALRYTKENDTITISAETKNNKEIELKIADTGIGMTEEDLKQIFNLFYRGTNSRREEGMGIGLSVVKNIIDTHNWKISVTSKKDEGSCFTINIPLNITD